MPRGTKVHKAAKAMQRKGMSVGKSIATAQKKTGQSYKTGKKTGKK